ncbi:DUF2218 domain-containing protein [Streptomyces scabiei]|uniref:DUF2218 domain-containing protein n=1 Tax=Streptomyces scabiei TaxID=1930 RepID=UPI001FF1278C|nr:DUF2218 domain-containing protein [Streptomyces sp. LBUM 1481]
MPTSLGRATTDAAPRYAKQLASHFGRKIPSEATPTAVTASPSSRPTSFSSPPRTTS